jgi:hypothetical protein
LTVPATVLDNDRQKVVPPSGGRKEREVNSSLVERLSPRG